MDAADEGVREQPAHLRRTGNYSKTDKDATFMHVKEDHMTNGHLKPCYNVNVATASEYVIGSYLSADCTDTNTLIPFTKQLPKSPQYLAWPSC